MIAQSTDASAKESQSKSKPDPKHGKASSEAAPIWRTAILSTGALFEALIWLAVGSYRVYESAERGWFEPVLLAVPFVMAVTWLYATLRPIVRPSATPPYDLFILFSLHSVSATLDIGVPIYMHYHSGWPLPGRLASVAAIVNLVTILVLLAVILAMPLGVRSERALKRQKVCGILTCINSL